MPEHVRYATADGLATITIDKPPYNVLDIALMDEMIATLERALADRDTRLLVLTGVGDKAFSAGVEVADHTPDKVERMLETFHGIFRHLARIEVPTLAAVNGVALGGGCELAIGCDMIVAASHAKLGQPEIKLGVFPPVAAVLLPRLLPPAKANELLLGGGTITADEALAFGLVNKVLPRERFDEGVRTFAAQFTHHSRVALIHTKRAMRDSIGQPVLAAIERAEQIYIRDLMATADAVEGLAAFMEKRQPAWKHA